jgi:hypothetical protein
MCAIVPSTMERLDELLGRYNPQTPDEILLIKRYIEEHFKAPASVALREDMIIITVTSGALANTLRLQSPKIQKAAQTRKRLIFRIG